MEIKPRVHQRAHLQFLSFSTILLIFSKQNSTSHKSIALACFMCEYNSIIAFICFQINKSLSSFVCMGRYQKSMSNRTRQKIQHKRKPLLDVHNCKSLLVKIIRIKLVYIRDELEQQEPIIRFEIYQSFKHNTRTQPEWKNCSMPGL